MVTEVEDILTSVEKAFLIPLFSKMLVMSFQKK